MVQREEPVKPLGHVLHVDPGVRRPGRKDFFAHTFNEVESRKAVHLNFDSVGYM